MNLAVSTTSGSQAESRQEWIDRLADRFDIVLEVATFADLQIEICRVRNPESILDEQQILASHHEVEWQPYWAQAWDAAVAMAHQFARKDFQGLNVLDLGCGLGITGAVIAARGGSVTLADYVPPALEFATVNCWPWLERTTIRKIDWTKDRLNEHFDLIVAAEILYDRNDLPHLDRFWRQHLSATGKVIHGDPNRAMTVEFFQTLQDLGWTVETEMSKIPDSDQKLRLATMTRAKSVSISAD